MAQELDEIPALLIGHIRNRKARSIKRYRKSVGAYFTSGYGLARAYRVRAIGTAWLLLHVQTVWTHYNSSGQSVACLYSIERAEHEPVSASTITPMQQDFWKLWR